MRLVKSIDQLNEAKAMGAFNKNITIKFNIGKTLHASERQSRHMKDDGDVDNYITDEEIMALLQKASPKIITDVINNHIDVEEKFQVKDPYTFLHLVCILHRTNKENELTCDVITVMREEFFRNKEREWIVEID